MAKQPSKSARDDSSAGRGAAAVSGNSGTVAAAEPAKAPDVSAATAETAADRAALLAVIKDMLDDLPGMIAELEYNARSSAQDQDHSEHAFYSRIASVFAEFRNELTTALNAPQV
jgi:hypothetical protein